jgi:acyl carrier protein
MDDKKIFEKITRVFQEVFEDETLEIDMDTSPGDISAWDSLKNVVLINQLEKTFNISFDLEEMMEFNELSKIHATIKKKIT